MRCVRETDSKHQQVLWVVFGLGLTLRTATAALVWAIVYNDRGADLSWSLFEPTVIAERWRVLDELQTVLIVAAVVVVAIQWPGFVGADSAAIAGYLISNVAAVGGGLVGQLIDL